MKYDVSQCEEWMSHPFLLTMWSDDPNLKVGPASRPPETKMEPQPETRKGALLLHARNKNGSTTELLC